MYVRSLRAAQRVMALLRRLYAKLHLVVNEGKSAVGGAFGRKFLGYSLWIGQGALVAAAPDRRQAAHLLAWLERVLQIRGDSENLEETR